MNIYVEIFGYIGTALVILSMMMTSVLWLRLFNIFGSLISLIYAAICGTWPIFLLNAVLVVINTVQLIRARCSGRDYAFVTLSGNDVSLLYFLERHSEDIRRYFPNFSPEQLADREVYTVFAGAEMTGITAGERNGDSLRIIIDYTTKKHRDLSVGRFLYPSLGYLGIRELVSDTAVEKHRKYLTRVGFYEREGALVKDIDSYETKGDT